MRFGCKTHGKAAFFMGIRAKMLLFFGFGAVLILVSVSLINLFGVPFTGIKGSYQAHRLEIIKRIDEVADLKMGEIRHWFEEHINRAKVFSEDHRLDTVIARFRNGIARGEGKKALLAGIRDLEEYREASRHIYSMMSVYNEYEKIQIADLKTGVVIFSTDEDSIGIDTSEDEAIKNARPAGVNEQVFFRYDKRKVVLHILYPVAGGSQSLEGGRPSLVAMFIVNPEKLLKKILHAETGLGRSGEVILVDMNRTILSPLKYPLPGNKKAEPLEYKVDTKPAELAVLGIDGIVFGDDYTGTPVIAAIRHIRLTSEFGLGMIAKINEEEILAVVRQTLKQSLLISGLGLLFILVLVYVFSGWITHPVIQLRRAAEKIMKGDLSARASVERGDEVGFLAASFNSMVEEIQKWNEELETKVRQRTAELDLELTQRKQAEETLARSEKNYRVLFREMLSGFARNEIICDSQGRPINSRYLEINPAFERITGLKAEEVVGRTLLEVFPSLEPSWIETFGRVALTGESIHFEKIASALGIWFDVMAFCPAPNQYACTFTDITERKLAEDELRKHREHLDVLVKERTASLSVKTKELTDSQRALMSLVEDVNEKSVQLVKAMEQAQSADRVKSAFLATMSHELRTPLNSIIGFTGIVLQGMSGPLNGEQTKQLGMVQNSANHLLALINDVLDISKIEAGQVEILKRPFDMRSVIEQALRAVMPLSAKKGLSLDSIIASDVGTIVSDQRRVTQILINLLNNAIKFSERGNVRITAKRVNSESANQFGGTTDTDFIEISVADTGIGIEPEDMEKLFRPFSQVETSLARNHEGTGLGLSICDKLVEMLGGTIRAESEWGKGSKFTFVIPVNSDQLSVTRNREP
jgi:PAS domain S-box-containing protein